jgi:hypothetical protein
MAPRLGDAPVVTPSIPPRRGSANGARYCEYVRSPDDTYFGVKRQTMSGGREGRGRAGGGGEDIGSVIDDGSGGINVHSLSINNTGGIGLLCVDACAHARGGREGTLVW